MERLALIYDAAEDISALVRDFLNDGPDAACAGAPESFYGYTSEIKQLNEIRTAPASATRDMRSMKKQFAIAALEECRGNKSKTAKQLGITRYTLDRLLQ